ncbi:MAG: ABC transporter [Verrucomicrobiales bacterium]|nr:ABC transporter [Verrucomicrobiales bacterium]
MIEVRGLRKEYAGKPAVKGLDFTVGRGEIVGFIGPNGAGKSTTMRILASFLSATAGTAQVAGFDVERDSMEVRRRVGYMPENNPLPEDMRVREYLKFRARLKGLSRMASRNQVDEVSGQLGLEEVRNKMIGHLSKGFRQRVGLADALVHEPDLLILDEPTIGLDPHQIMAVRELIKKLSADRTVLISSHILPEVEVTCNRLLIMHRGSLLAADTQSNLQKRIGGATRVVAELSAPEGDLRTAWEEMGEVRDFHLSAAEGDFRRCVLMPRDGVDLRPRVADLAHARGWTLRELSENRATLEDIFVQLTRPDDEEEDLF